MLNFIPLTKDISKIIRTQEDKQTWVPKLYASSNWHNATPQVVTPSEIGQIPYLGVVRTDNIIVLDFDDDELYNEAVKLNKSLHPDYQCKLVVRSNRKGGHFYYLKNEYSDTIADLPWKNSKIDILTGPRHNVFAPSLGDAGKTIVYSNDTLTYLPEAMGPFIKYCIVSTSVKKITSVAKAAEGTYSDDNIYLIDQFITGSIPRDIFLTYYNLPDVMPDGQSQHIMLRLAYRLLNDETLNESKVRQVLELYDNTNRKTKEEIDGLLNMENKYVPYKLQSTVTFTHFKYKTSISVFMDMEDNSHIIVNSNNRGQLEQIVKPRESDAILYLEKISATKKQHIRQKVHLIRPVKVIKNYSLRGGYNSQDDTYNLAYINKYLRAFQGTKPDNYSYPKRLIELCKFMWADEFDYLLTHTHLRYKTFKHSPVVHHLKGVEGTGKDLSVYLLTAGFPDIPQIVAPEDVSDKHRTYQVQDNCIFQEVGDWLPKPQQEAISGLKSVTGGNGYISVRGMGTAKTTVPTICKIWVLGNHWMKLHTGTKVDRRVHAVHMPRHLFKQKGGPYDSSETLDAMVQEELEDFYYWLGNEYKLVEPDTAYFSAISRQKSESYETYLAATEGKAEIIARLLDNADWTSFLKALHMVDKDLEHCEYKYSSDKNLVITLNSLRTVFGNIRNAKIVFDTLDYISAQAPGTGKLNFESGQRKYMTVFGAPLGLGSGVKVEQLQIKD